MRARGVLVVAVLGLAGCGDDGGPGVPTFNKTVPSVERRYHGRPLAAWKDLDPGAPAELRAATAYALAALETEPAQAEPLLLELLADEDASVRLAAVVACGRLRVPSARVAEVLVGHFDSPDEPLRRHARLAAGQMGAPAAPALVRALESESARVRWAATSALAFVREAGAAAVPRLRALAEQDASESVRRLALLTLPRLGPSGVEATLPFLRHEDPVRRQEAATGLAGAGEDAVAPLAALLDAEDAEVAALAAGILADLGPLAEPALDALVRAFARPGPPRFNAAEALVAIGAPARPHLERLARSEDEDVKAVAEYALDKLGRR